MAQNTEQKNIYTTKISKGGQRERIEALFALSRNVSTATAMYLLIQKLDKKFGFRVIFPGEEEKLEILKDDVVMPIVLSSLSSTRSTGIVAEKTIDATVKIGMSKLGIEDERVEADLIYDLQRLILQNLRPENSFSKTIDAAMQGND